jgi:hypothetical protein
VVSRAELLAAGVTRQEIAHRLEVGALIPEFRGVYRAGHRAPSTEARYMAAVKACGQGAVLSGLAAAHLFGLVKGPAPQPEVTAPTERRVNGVKTRRRRMDSRDATKWHKIPITTVPRTLVDLSSLLPLTGWPAQSTRQVSATGQRRPRSRTRSTGCPARADRGSCAASCVATST